MKGIEEGDSEVDAESEEEKYFEEAIPKEEEERSQDDSGPQANMHLWGHQDVMGVAAVDNMQGGQLFQDDTSLVVLGMGGSSGADYNGLQEVCNIHRSADTPAGGSSGYVTESNGPHMPGPRNSSLLDNSHNFRGTLDMWLLDHMLYETPINENFYSQFVNNTDG